MISDSRTEHSPPAEQPGNTAEALLKEPQKQPVKVRRSQDKFPRSARIALMLAAPAALWAALYLAWRAL